MRRRLLEPTLDATKDRLRYHPQRRGAEKGMPAGLTTSSMLMFIYVFLKSRRLRTMSSNA